MNAETRRALVRYLVSYAAAGGRSDFVGRTQREIEEGLAADDRRVEELERRVEELEKFHAAARAGGFSAILAPAAAAVLEREHGPGVEEIADELVAFLFRTGQGNQAVRLELVDNDGRGSGGWGQGPLRDQVLVALKRAAAAPTANLEAIQDEEAILRLALAFKALAADTSRNAGGQIYDLAWRMAEYLENPEEARGAIDRAKARDRRAGITR